MVTKMHSHIGWHYDQNRTYYARLNIYQNPVSPLKRIIYSSEEIVAKSYHLPHQQYNPQTPRQWDMLPMQLKVNVVAADALVSNEYMAITASMMNYND